MGDATEQWWVRFQGRITGPYTFEQLQNLVRRGTLTRMHRVSTDRTRWVSASQAVAAEPAPPPQPEQPSQRPTNTSTEAPESDDRVGVRAEAVAAAEADHAPAHAAPHQWEPTDRAAPTQFQPAPDEQALNWYYEVDGHQVGPVSEGLLRKLSRSGQLAPDTQVWRPGLAGWLDLRVAPIDLDLPPNHHSASQSPGNQQLAGAEPAGFWLRLFAFILDSVIVGTVAALLAGALMAVADVEPLTREEEAILNLIIAMLCVSAISIIYFTLCHFSSGQTAGKRLLSIKAVSFNGGPIRFSSGLWRAILVSGPALPTAVGALISPEVALLAFWSILACQTLDPLILLLNANKRSLHDLACSTRVIRI